MSIGLPDVRHELRRGQRSVLFLAVLLAVRAPAFADTESGEVVVVAERTPARVSETARSVGVTTGEQLRKLNLDSIGEAAALHPGIHIVELSNRKISFPVFRGIGSGAANPAVGTFLDGVPQPTLYTGNLALFDIDQVEFLRGPAGALYGRNTLSGAVNIRTRRPGGRPETALALGGGNFASRTVTLVHGGPLLGNRLAYRVSGRHSARDGFNENGVTGTPLDDQEGTAARVQALWTPGERWSVLAKVFGERDRDGPFAVYALDRLRLRPHEARYDFVGSNDRDVLIPSLNVSFEGSRVTLTSLTALHRWKTEEWSDTDFSDLKDPFFGTGSDLFRRWSSDEQWQATQELLVGTSEGRPLVLGRGHTAGLLFGSLVTRSKRETRAFDDIRIPTPVPLPPFFSPNRDWKTADFDDTGIGVFGRGSVTLADRLEVSGTLRFDQERRRSRFTSFIEIPGSSTPPVARELRDTYDGWMPQASLSYRVTDSLMPYVHVAKSFRSGGHDQNAPAGEEAFRPESSRSYEAGLKSSWFEGRLTANLSGYLVDWSDMQLFVTNPNKPVLFYTENAGASRVRGGEVEVAVTPAPGLDVRGGAGATEAVFRRHTDPLSGRSVRGRSLALAPKFTWVASSSYSRPLAEGLAGLLGLVVRGTGPMYFDVANTAREPSRTTVDANAGVSWGRATFRVWVKNATDEAYVPTAFQVPDPLTLAFAFVGENGPPRTIGTSLSVGF